MRAHGRKILTAWPLNSHDRISLMSRNTYKTRINHNKWARCGFVRFGPWTISNVIFHFCPKYFQLVCSSSTPEKRKKKMENPSSHTEHTKPTECKALPFEPANLIEHHSGKNILLCLLPLYHSRYCVHKALNTASHRIEMMEGLKFTVPLCLYSVVSCWIY